MSVVNWVEVTDDEVAETPDLRDAHIWTPGRRARHRAVLLHLRSIFGDPDLDDRAGTVEQPE